MTYKVGVKPYNQLSPPLGFEQGAITWLYSSNPLCIADISDIIFVFLLNSTQAISKRFYSSVFLYQATESIKRDQQRITYDNGFTTAQHGRTCWAASTIEIIINMGTVLSSRWLHGFRETTSLALMRAKKWINKT